MSALLWIGVVFFALGAVALGILLSVPVIIGMVSYSIHAELVPMIKKYLRNRFHPLRRKTPLPMYWL